MTRGFIEALAVAQSDAVVDPGAVTPVITPSSIDALSSVLRLAAEHSTKLVLASSGHTHSQPSEQRVPPNACVLSLAKLTMVHSIDTDSRIVHVESGATMADLETIAAEHAWTFGAAADPADPNRGTLGPVTVLDWISSPSFRAGKDNDPVSQHIAGADVVLASGEQLTIRPAPRRAVGPALLPAFIGAHGRLGIVTAVHLVARQEAHSTHLRFDFPTRDAALAALAWIRGRGARPTNASVNGTELLLSFPKDGPRAEAVERVIRDVVGARGGRPVSTDVKPQAFEPAKPWPLSRAVAKLAQQLDPAGVLQP